MDSHAKVPWILGESVEGDPIILAEDRLIAIVPVAFSSESGAWSTYKSRNAKADFEFIVRAVNAHEELLNAIKTFVRLSDPRAGQVEWSDALKIGKQAIAKVERK